MLYCTAQYRFFVKPQCHSSNICVITSTMMLHTYFTYEIDNGFTQERIGTDICKQLFSSTKVLYMDNIHIILYLFWHIYTNVKEGTFLKK